jgi:hypothetical protein
MEMFMIVAWIIWKERNDYIFNQKPPSLATWKASFKAEVLEHFIRIKSEFHACIMSWLGSL